MHAHNQQHNGTPLRYYELGGGTVESRAEFAIERAGVSITITSITNFLAFSLGSITVIPAVRWFCIYASVTILCDFLVQMSLFLAIVVIYERDDQAGRDRHRS